MSLKFFFIYHYRRIGCSFPIRCGEKNESKYVKREIRHLASQMGEIENPPDNHHIQRQAGLQVAGIRQAMVLGACAALEGAM